MIKNSLIKSLIFFNYLLCFIPWISPVFLSGLGVSGFALAVGSWCLMVFFVQLLSYLLDRWGKWGKGFIFILSLGSAWGVALLLIPHQNLLMRIAFALVTMVVWIAGAAISSAYRLSELMEGKYLIPGLFILSFSALAFPDSKGLIYGCFGLYLLLSALLILLTAHRNKTVPGMMMAATLAAGLVLAGVRDWIIGALLLFYRHVVVRILLYILTPLAYLAGGAASKLKVEEWIEPPEYMTDSFQDQIGEMERTVEDKASGLNLWPYINIALIVLLFLVLGIVVIRLLRRYTAQEEEDPLESKEAVNPDIHLFGFFREKGKKAVGVFRRTLYAATPEGKIRKMFRDTMEKMRQRSYPVTKSTTAKEAMDMLGDGENALFHAYHKVRYQEKEITTEDLSRAEESFQRIQEKL
ncbi:MAG: hypothetical protein ACOX6S_13000 [Clostridia bacterium]|jgi:hypothetical protein